MQPNDALVREYGLVRARKIQAQLDAIAKARRKLLQLVAAK